MRKLRHAGALPAPRAVNMLSLQSSYYTWKWKRRELPFKDIRWIQASTKGHLDLSIVLVEVLARRRCCQAIMQGCSSTLSEGLMSNHATMTVAKRSLSWGPPGSLADMRSASSRFWLLLPGISTRLLLSKPMASEEERAFPMKWSVGATFATLIYT